MEFKDDFQFEFDQPQPEKQPSDREGIIDLAEPMNRLTCSCPNCGANLELEPPEAGQQVVETSCPACNTAVCIVRESSATRARQRSGQLNCAACGSRLDHNPHCTSCGAPFPDYFVAVTREEMKRRTRNKRRSDLKQVMARFNPSLRLDFSRSRAERNLFSRDTAHAPVREGGKQALVTPRAVRLIIALVVLVVLAGGGGYAFRLHQQHQQYAENYFRALYALKSCNDFALQTCSRMESEWKAATASGAAYSPRPNDKELSRIKRTQQDLDVFLQQMTPPPSRFAAAHQKLLDLREAYRKSQNLAISPPGTLQTLTASAGQAGSGFSMTARELKSTLPDPLKKEFENAKTRYRGLDEV